MNSQPQRWRLPQPYRELLRNMMKDGPTEIVSSEQRRALRRICSSPERKVFPPEDLLIAFKFALVDAANEAAVPLGPQRNAFLDRLVSAYIEEFYRSPAEGESFGEAGTQELAAGGA